MMHRAGFLLVVLAAGATLLSGCESDIRPLRPLVRAAVLMPAEKAAASSEPATTQTGSGPSTQTASPSQPTTRPGARLITVIDPNQTTRFIYKADYDNIWRQALDMFTKAGFTPDRLDYRLGVMTTQFLPSSQIVEFWKPQQTTVKNAMENTMHSQQRRVRLTIAPAAGKPDFYEIGMQVLVERLTNPAEEIGGPIFVEGSGFGAAAVTLRSDYIMPGKKDQPAIWVPIGHDPDLENKLLNKLFKRI